MGQSLSSLGANAQELFDKAKELERNSTGASVGVPALTDSVLFDRETSIRRALILALGEYDPNDLDASKQDHMVNWLINTCTQDPDSGIHAASEWTLRRWKQDERLEK